MIIDYPTTRGKEPDPLRPLATIKLDGLSVVVTGCDDGKAIDLWITWENERYGKSKVPVVVNLDVLRKLGESLIQVADKLLI